MHSIVTMWWGGLGLTSWAGCGEAVTDEDITWATIVGSTSERYDHD